jgi:hypothetical protein
MTQVDTVPTIIRRIQNLLNRHDNPDSDWLPLARDVQDTLDATLATLTRLYELELQLRRTQDEIEALRQSKLVTLYR